MEEISARGNLQVGRDFGGHSVDLEASITLIDLKGKAESWAEV